MYHLVRRKSDGKPEDDCSNADPEERSQRGLVPPGVLSQINS